MKKLVSGLMVISVGGIFAWGTAQAADKEYNLKGLKMRAPEGLGLYPVKRTRY